jgi:hypothetical protein
MRRLLALCLLLIPSPALAWSEAGHKIIASIAFRRLTPREQQAFVDLLKQHPRYVEDFEQKIPEDLEPESLNEWLFQQAAIWPDMARGFKGEAAKYNHPIWHYVDEPLFLTDADETALKGHIAENLSATPPDNPEKKMNVIQTMRLARSMLASREVPASEKAVMFCWLMHTVGDIHQPLHSTAMFSRKLFPKGDKGGNSVKTQQHGNLHSLWDSFLGGKIKFRTARNRAIELYNEPAMQPRGMAAAKDLNEEHWVAQSHKLAAEYAYTTEVVGALRQFEPTGEPEPIRLSEEYLKTGGGVARKQANAAGYRLAVVLREITE